MITVTCDKCDREISFEDALAGQKVECPHCGDVNRLPGAGAVSAEAPGAGAREQPSEAGKRRDRAAEAGYPPDSGEEQRVVRVRRCWVRSRPAAFTGVVIIALAGPAGLIWSVNAEHPAWVRWVWPIVTLAAIGVLGWWWVERLGEVLEITNKRTIARHGLLSRSTSEVVHDNIRNVQVDQSFWQRIWGVGKLGISSSGQDGIEIEMNHLRQPDKIRRVIDLYRPL